ncbi:MAG: putative toxin-antitoxin system toxin component, PIN family [Acidobacteria bacterium]|nr:putative toxin-antitoxin system toxin component, PIN family [Acidobacteriota bacterium]
MIRLVLDTNLIVSFALSPNGLAAVIFEMVAAGLVRLFISRAVVDEYVDVLGRRELHIPSAARRRVLRAIELDALWVPETSRIEACSDPDDNIFLECAEAAKAHYLITENVRHFPKTWKYTRVLRPGQFLKLWETQKPLGL